MEKIGLFPLSVVVFPGSIYPLHIFEERYKQLINGCIENNSRFGINLISGGKINPIGTACVVFDVINRHSDGKLDITVKGVERFRIENFKDGEKPYFVANVHYWDDREDVGSYQVILEDCVELFNKIAKKIRTFNIHPVSIEDFTTILPSFAMAQKAGLSPAQKQLLLEMDTEKERLTYLRSHLKLIMPSINKFEQIETIIKNDGYISPDIM